MYRCINLASISSYLEFQTSYAPDLSPALTVPGIAGKLKVIARYHPVIDLHRWGRGSVYKCLVFVYLFDLFLYVPVNNFSDVGTGLKQGLMCLAQGHNAVTPVRLKLATPLSRVKHSTTEPLRSHK